MNKINSFNDADNHIALLLVKSAKQKLKKKNFIAALKDTDKAIELNDKLSSAYFIRGEIFCSNDTFTVLTKLKNQENALKNYNIAIQIDPNSPENFEGRGKLYFKQAKYGAAKNDFTNAITLMKADSLILKPDPLDQFPLMSFSLFERRGQANFKLGQYEEARMDFSKVLELSELAEPSILSEIYSFNEIDILESRGYANLKCGYFREAIDDLSLLLTESDNPSDFNKHLLRAVAYANNENYELALDDISTATNINENCFKENEHFLEDLPDDFKGILKIYLPQKYLEDLDLSI